MQTSTFVAVQSWILMKLSFLFDTDRSPLYREVWELKRKNDQLTKELADATRLLQALQADNEILVGCLEYVKGERDRWFHQCLEASSQLKDAETHNRVLEELAMKDEGTNLLNSRGMANEWAKLVSNLHRKEKSIHVLFVDVDRMKQINDTHGHQIGNEALRLVARKMEEAFREGDSIGRIGGDEFAIIMPDATKEGALKRADDLKELLEVESKKNKWGVSVSIGIARALPNENWESAKARADRPLYESKLNRNSVTYYDE